MQGGWGGSIHPFSIALVFIRVVTSELETIGPLTGRQPIAGPCFPVLEFIISFINWPDCCQMFFQFFPVWYLSWWHVGHYVLQPSFFFNPS